MDDYIERKHGRQEITYLHAVMETALKETYGLIVYQEQAMQIAPGHGGLHPGPGGFPPEGHVQETTRGHGR